jgi:hypothetical protein
MGFDFRFIPWIIVSSLFTTGLLLLFVNQLPTVNRFVRLAIIFASLIPVPVLILRHSRLLRSLMAAQYSVTEDSIIVRRPGCTETYPLTELRSGKNHLSGKALLGEWDEYGGPGHSIKLDRRYLRPLHDSVDLFPLAQPTLEEEHLEQRSEVDPRAD